MAAIIPQVPRGALCALLVVLAGCQPAPPQLQPCDMPSAFNAQAANGMATVPGGAMQMMSVGRRGVRMIDGLTDMVYVEDVLAMRRPTGTVDVAVRILNCTTQPIQFEAAVQFFDEGGAQAETPTIWKRVFLPPRTTRDYIESSTSRRVGAFVVEVRGGT